MSEAGLKAGDRIPEFELPNVEGRLVTSEELLARGPLVLSFFRGGWCPYCALELVALQEALPDIAARGANAAAITPDTGAAFAAVKRDNYAAVAWFNFDIGASPHTLAASNYVYASGTSYDWHPAINANRVAAPAG